MHPSIKARQALLEQLPPRVNPLGAEVLDWYPPADAKGAAVCITDATADLERDRFAAANRVSYTENWTQNIEIRVPNSLRDNHEAAVLVTAIFDEIVANSVGNHTLGIAEVVRALPATFEMSVDGDYMVGTVGLQCTYRFNRTSS